MLSREFIATTIPRSSMRWLDLGKLQVYKYIVGTQVWPLSFNWVSGMFLSSGFDWGARWPKDKAKWVARKKNFPRRAQNLTIIHGEGFFFSSLTIANAVSAISLTVLEVKSIHEKRVFSSLLGCLFGRFSGRFQCHFSPLDHLTCHPFHFHLSSHAIKWFDTRNIQRPFLN